MKRLLFFIVCFFCIVNIYSQNRNNIWYFGSQAGLDFSTNPPTALHNPAFSTTEGSSTICDNSGNLLFYSNGLTVWNRNHVPMVNGTGLLGGNSATQSCLIIPKPCDDSIYYIFTISQLETPALNQFCYSVVNMNLSGGLGEVTQKNIVLFQPSFEKITGVLKPNGTDYWVLIKEVDSNNFLAFTVNTSGVDPNPVISTSGSVQPINNILGYLRFSHDGTKVCAPYWPAGPTEVFDFDVNTGIVSNPVSLNTPAPYGAEFSPDDSKLYVGLWNSGRIYQYDMLAGSATAIQNSEYLVRDYGGGANVGALMLGADNRIYVDVYGRYYLDVIGQPNQPGAACAFAQNFINLSPGSCQDGLPNNVYRFSSCNSACGSATNNAVTTSICSGQTYQLPSGTVVNSSGIYYDTIRNVIGTCDSIITTINLFVSPVSNVNTAAEICAGQTYQLPSGTIVNATGIYQDTIRNVNSCDSVITTVNLSVFPVNNVNTAVEICTGHTYQLPSGTIVNTAGIYNDTLQSVSGCDSLITIVNLSVFPVNNVSAAALICAGHTYQLPSGTIINTAGIYLDTLRSVSGCDSLITTLDLSVFPVNLISTEVQICSNQSYQLPSSGTIVHTAGYYLDTTRSVNSCDSIINTIHLLVSSVSASSITDSIYEGEPYVLPSGQTVSSPGTYETVLVNSVGCDSVITTTLKKKKELAECITLRNAITPNGDGINDYLILYRYPCFKKLELHIYNRYGSQVYQSPDYKNDWNGKYRGKELPDGTYYYIVKVYTYDNKQPVFKNNVTILR